MIALLIACTLFVLAIMGIAAFVLYTDLLLRINLQHDLIISLNQRLRSYETAPDVVIYSDEKVKWN